MTKFIGLSLYYVVKFARQNYPLKFKEILNQLDSSTREKISAPIMSNEWYDLKVVQDFLDSYYKLTSEAGVIESARDSVKNQLKGIFGLFLKFISVSFMLKNSQYLWNKVFSEGKISVTQEGDNLYKIVISDFKLNSAHQLWLKHYFHNLLEVVSKKEYRASMYKNDSEYHYIYNLIG